MLASERGAGGDKVSGCALKHDPPAVVTRAGPKVDDAVGVRHDRLVVGDDDHRLAGVHEPVQQPEQLLEVGHRLSRSWRRTCRATSPVSASRSTAVSLARSRSLPTTET